MPVPDGAPASAPQMKDRYIAAHFSIALRGCT